MHLAQVADAAGDRQLDARRAQARSREFAAIDGVARHDVQPRLRRRCREATGEALIEVQLRMLEREKQVLFDGDRLESERRRLVDERQVRVRLNEARH